MSENETTSLFPVELQQAWKLEGSFSAEKGILNGLDGLSNNFFSLASLCGESLNTAPLEAVLVMEGCHLVNSYYWKPISHVQYF